MGNDRNEPFICSIVSHRLIIGGKLLRFAISTDNQNVSAHFGRCPSFTLVDIQDRKVVDQKTLDNPGHQPGNIPRFLKEKGVDCIVTGGMGMRAMGFFEDFQIETIVGVQGPVKDVIAKIVEGTLSGGQSLCQPGDGKGYGLDKTECDHPDA
jgi:predicted Fe-Mo cluster-binding NifX family protein